MQFIPINIACRKWTRLVNPCREFQTNKHGKLSSMFERVLAARNRGNDRKTRVYVQLNNPSIPGSVMNKRCSTQTAWTVKNIRIRPASCCCSGGKTLSVCARSSPRSVHSRLRLQSQAQVCLGRVVKLTLTTKNVLTEHHNRVCLRSTVFHTAWIADDR